MPVASGGESNSAATSSAQSRTSTATSLVSRSVNSQTTAAASAQGCQTLSLTLGPVQLDLLGTTVQLDQVNVDFIARSSGQLDTLLCGATSAIGNTTGSAQRMNILNMLLNTAG